MASIALLASVAVLVCFLNINLAEAKTYRIMKTKANWFKAYLECRLIGDRLASIESETEQKTLVAMIEKDNDANNLDTFYIGLTDLAKEGSHRWFATGKPSSYFNWADNQPDNKNDEDCVSMVKSKGYKWNDGKCTDEHYFICETDLL